MSITMVPDQMDVDQGDQLQGAFAPHFLSHSHRKHVFLCHDYRL